MYMHIDVYLALDLWTRVPLNQSTNDLQKKCFWLAEPQTQGTLCGKKAEPLTYVFHILIELCSEFYDNSQNEWLFYSH